MSPLHIARWWRRSATRPSQRHPRPAIARDTAGVLLVLLMMAGPASLQRGEDAGIRQVLIDESIRAFQGSCPCPYSVMKNGRRCGTNSAHAKPGGPLCYPTDVSDEMVQAYRLKHKS